MRAQRIATLMVMAVPLIQANLHHMVPRELAKRQGGDSFIPGTIPTSSCAPEDICAGSICLDRPRGDVCCKEGYGCPGGSFCLTQGYCCPDGDSVDDCAAANGVTLSSGFDTSALPSPTAASSATSSTSIEPATTLDTVSSSTTPSPPAVPVTTSDIESSAASSTAFSTPEVSSTTSMVAPVITSSASAPLYTVSSSVPTTPPVGTGTGANVPATSSMSLFTGAAARHADVGSGLAIILGLLGYVV